MSGIFDKTGESNGMNSIDPMVNKENIMTAAAELAIVKAGFVKPKEYGVEPSFRTHS